jgi:glucose-1-phosphate thymidylyltransferase
LKALVLAGGRGTRLRPITHTSAKQLVPVANKPVLFYGIESLRDAGISEIGVVVADPAEMLKPDSRTGQMIPVMVNSQAEIRAALGDGSKFGVHVSYIVQEAPLGLAHAVKIAEEFVAGDSFVMYLGDNLIKDGIVSFVQEFEREKPDAQILLAHVPNPGDFGVAELDGEHVVRLEEKPAHPKSDLALVGVYLFGPPVFDAVRAIQPSPRGELEITDAIQYLITSGKRVRSHVITGWWKDTGKVEDMLEANRIVLAGLPAKIEGTVDAATRIEGALQLGAGSSIERSHIRGPVVIGAGVMIRDAYIGPYTSIADGAVIDHAELEHSIVLERSRLEHVSQRIESSLIGREAVVTSSGLRPRAHRMMIGDSSRVELA